MKGQAYSTFFMFLLNCRYQFCNKVLNKRVLLLTFEDGQGTACVVECAVPYLQRSGERKDIS